MPKLHQKSWDYHGTTSSPRLPQQSISECQIHTTVTDPVHQGSQQQSGDTGPGAGPPTKWRHWPRGGPTNKVGTLGQGQAHQRNGDPSPRTSLPTSRDIGPGKSSRRTEDVGPGTSPQTRGGVDSDSSVTCDSSLEQSDSSDSY